MRGGGAVVVVIFVLLSVLLPVILIVPVLHSGLYIFPLVVAVSVANVVVVFSVHKRSEETKVLVKEPMEAAGYAELFY